MPEKMRNRTKTNVQSNHNLAFTNERKVHHTHTSFMEYKQAGYLLVHEFVQIVFREKKEKQTHFIIYVYEYKQNCFFFHGQTRTVIKVIMVAAVAVGGVVVYHRWTVQLYYCVWQWPFCNLLVECSS